jgi:hypothetical protein
MAIKKAGKSSIGSEASDIVPYLTKYTATQASYPAVAFRPVVCGCKCDRFWLRRAGSITLRACVECDDNRFIERFGSGSGWEEMVDDQGDEPYRCQGCKGEEANVCVGFADYARHAGIRKQAETALPDAALWFYVGVRCVKCGRLECFNEGKVGRGPMAEQTFREITGEPPNKGRTKKKKGQQGKGQKGPS